MVNKLSDRLLIQGAKREVRFEDIGKVEHSVYKCEFDIANTTHSFIITFSTQYGYRIKGIEDSKRYRSCLAVCADAINEYRLLVKTEEKLLGKRKLRPDS